MRPSAIRAQTEMFANDPESSINKQPDRDLEKVLDIVSATSTSSSSSKDSSSLVNNTSAMRVIKYLSEIPLIDMRYHVAYDRKHRICRALYLMIQEDLRNAIQCQLMSEDNAPAQSAPSSTQHSGKHRSNNASSQQVQSIGGGTQTKDGTLNN